MGAGSGGKGGGEVAPPKQPNFTHTYDDVQGMIQGVQVAGPGPQTMDIRMSGPYKGMSSSAANFLQRYGKPYGAMTPEEQKIVASGGDLPMPTPMPTPVTPMPTPVTPMPTPMPTPVTPMPTPMPSPGVLPSILTSMLNPVRPSPVTPSPTTAPTPQTPQPFSAPRGFNVNQAAASGLQDALGGTRRAIGNTGMFTNYVTDRTLADLERQRQMQQNQIGAQASSAGAYGGSRHGVAEALTNEAFARQGADTFGNLQLGQQQAQMSGAAQLGQLGQQAFNTGRQINQDMMQQGLLQQSLQQALIDSAANDMSNYANAPMNSLGAPLAALGAANMNQQTQTTTQNPGLLGTLGALKYIMGPSAAVIPGL